MYFLINAILILDYNEWIGECDKGYLYSSQISLATHAIYSLALMKKNCCPCILFWINAHG